MNQISTEMKKMRQQLGLTQRELAEKTGIKLQVIKDNELGRSRVFADVYIKIKQLWEQSRGQNAEQ